MSQSDRASASLTPRLIRAAVFVLAIPAIAACVDDGLFVVNGIGAAADLVGSRIDRIGPLATAEVLRRLEPYTSRAQPSAR